MKRVEQIRVQQAEIKLKSSEVRSRIPIWTHVKRYLEKKGKRKEESGYQRKPEENCKRKAAKNDMNAAKARTR